MSHHAEPNVAQVADADKQLRKFVEYQQSPETLRSTACEVELFLFREMLAMGRTLLKIFMDRRATVTGPGFSVCRRLGHS